MSQVTIRSCLKRHRTKLDINVALSTIVAVSIWFSLFAHTTACLWYTIGVHYDAIKPHSSWMHKDDGSLHCANQYVCSLYVILATFTHKRVGKVTPKNHLEVQFMIILEILSTMMFIIYVGEFSNIIQYKSYRSFGYYSKFLELQDFLSNNRVSKNLVKLVCRYSLHLWRESRGLQMPYLLETAPPCFKLKIMRGAYMHHLIMHPSFKDCEPAFLRQLVGCLTLFRYNTDLFVVREGEITDSMYLVHNGRVVEIDEDMDEETNEFTAGNHFGQVQGLIRDTPYNYSYKTTSKAEVLTLSLNNWEQLLEYFPISRYSIFKHYPNHPYSKYPSNKPKQRLDKQNEEKKREVIGQRKTEHELKGKPLNQRDLSHSESKNYKPFNSPLKVTSAGKSSKPDTAAPKSLNTVPGDIISTTKQTITKTPAAADSTTKPTATKVSATADPAAKRSTVEVKESGAKITTRLTVGAKMAAVASGAVVTGASVARPAALPASPTRNISATETLPAALSSIGKVSPTSTSRLTASKPTLIDNSDMIFKQKSEKNTLASTLEIPENSIWKSERMMPISNEDEDKHTKKATTRLNDETNESTYVAESPSISESNYIAQPPTISSNIRIASETVLKNDPSLPYFEYDTDDDSKKKEEHKLSEEFEVAPQSFMRRVTQHAKKLIGRQSAIKGSGETNPLELEEDVKATSALLQKYEEKSKKLKKPGADDGEKSLLEQYIEKHDAELASTQKEESEEEIFTRDSPRRSIVIFGNEDAPPVRNIPLEQPDDNDEVAKISRTSRRSVVVFDSEGNSSLGVLIPEETIYDSHELNDKDFQSAYEESNEKEFDYNATTVFIPSNSQSMSVNALDGSLVESNQNKISQDNTENFKEQKDEYTELPLTIAGDSKIKNFDLKQFLEDPNPTDDTISLPNVADYNINANETTTAPQSSFVSQSSTVPSSSSLKKPAVKTSLLASLFRKRKPAPNNKHENKTKASSATTEVAETSNENEGYESKLADEDDFGAEKKITHVRYVGDKVNDDETLILDDDDFEEGPSKPLSPEQILIDDDIQIKDMTEDEKKLMMMDSDVDPLFRRKDEDKKKTN